MARRESYSSKVICECGESGEVTWSEYENPMHTGLELDRRIEKLPVEFESHGGTTIICKKCRAKLPD